MQNFKNSVALYAEIYMSYLYLVNNVRMFTTLRHTVEFKLRSCKNASRNQLKIEHYKSQLLGGKK